MDALSACLLRNKVQYIRIDGKTNRDIRHSSVSSFQNNPDIRCAVLSIRACSAGITLTAASHVIFAELDWTPNAITQAEGRVHRIGQSRQVECCFLIAPNTCDDVMWKLLKTKQENLQKVGLVGDHENLTQNIAKSNFQAGPSVPNQRLITDYKEKSNEAENLSRDSPLSFYTCPDFSDDFDLSDIENAAAKPQRDSVEKEEVMQQDENLDDLIFDDDDDFVYKTINLKN